MAVPTLADGPEEITVIHASSEVAVPPQDPVRDPARAFVADPTRTFVDDPARCFLGEPPPGGRPPRDPAAETVSIQLGLGSQPETISVSARSLPDGLIALYTVGGWPWVHEFLVAVGKVVFPVGDPG